MKFARIHLSRRPGRCSILVSSLVAMLLLITTAFGAPAKILPMGDSITRGTNDINYPNGSIPGGNRKNLGSKLSTLGLAYDFVGARTDNAAAGMDPDHYGINGIRTDEVLSNLGSYLAYQPDNVLMLLGTNDMIQGIPIATAANNLNSLIVQITANAPHRRLYVGTLPAVTGKNWGTRTAATINADANSYNIQVRNLVQQNLTAGRRVALVDFANLIVYNDPGNSANNFFQPGDGVHPGQAGYDQMANIWFNAITKTGSLLDPPPAAPTQAGATAASSTTINVTWTDASSDETGFKLERKREPNESFSEITTLPAGATSYKDTGLAPSTGYTYRLRATSEMGDSGYSNSATSTTLTPYDSWAGNYPAFQQLPPSARLPSADPNGDGISNLLSYGLAIDPLSNTAAAFLPRLTRSADSFLYEFRRNALAPDLTQQVLVSHALSPANWTVQSQAGALVENLSSDGSVQRVTLTIPMSSGTNLFVRLKVIQQ